MLRASPKKSASPSSESDRNSQSSRKSTTSRSRRTQFGSDRSSQLSIRQGPEKQLKLREYLLLLVEASLSLASFVIGNRNVSRGKLAKINSTSRQVQIYNLYPEGYSTLMSLFFGCLADSWLSHYTVALFSVIVHFAAVGLIFMEDIVERSQQHNPYTILVWNVCVAATILIQSTDFTRLVYGLEGMTSKKDSTIFIFIFLQFWVSTYAANGGIFVNACAALVLYLNLDPVILAFVMSGLSMFVFVYLLSPETDAKENRGLGCQAIGCILLAIFYKAFRIRKQWHRGFLGNTEGKFKRTTVSRTKELLSLYVMILPSFGIVFNIMQRTHLYYRNIIEKIKPEKYVEAVGIIEFSRTVLLIGMLVSYFALWPFLTFLGVKDKQSLKFLVGHLLAVVSFFYAAILMKQVEPLPYPSGSGLVRIFNTRKDRIHFVSEDQDFRQRNFYVNPKEAETLAYQSLRETLFAMRVKFDGTNSSFVSFFASTPYKTIGYMILEPPEVVRIRGPYLPLREGPPGTNTRGWAKIFIYNTAKSLYGSMVTIKYAHRRKTLREVAIQPGTMTIISLAPGLYDFTIARGEIKKIVNIEQGALYGLMIYSTTTSRGMAVDTVIGPNTASAWPCLGLYFVIGLANGISYPPLKAMIYTFAPHGLKAMSFAFLSFLEGISLWVSYVGFKTWHTHVTGTDMYYYASCLTVFFLLSSYIMLKYHHKYNI